MQCVFVQAGKSVLDSPINEVISCCTEAPAYKSAPLLTVVECFYPFLIKLSRHDVETCYFNMICLICYFTEEYKNLTYL